MSQPDYTVRLEQVFQGPMDLLLHLVRRTEVDIHEIPLSDICDQYMAMLREVDEIDFDLAGEFLVMAATLTELKSRTLVPTEVTADDEAGEPGTASLGDLADPRHELIQQLLAYQRFREAAEAMESKRSNFARLHPAGTSATRRPDPVEDNGLPMLDLEDVHLLDLSDSYERIVSSIDFSMIGDHHVLIDDTPIEVFEEELLERLEQAPRHAMTLQDAFQEADSPHRVGYFLAMLELVRTNRITVAQDDIDDDILVRMAEEEDER